MPTDQLGHAATSAHFTCGNCKLAYRVPRFEPLPPKEVARTAKAVIYNPPEYSTNCPRCGHRPSEAE